MKASKAAGKRKAEPGLSSMVKSPWMQNEFAGLPKSSKVRRTSVRISVCSRVSTEAVVCVVRFSLRRRERHICGAAKSAEKGRPQAYFLQSNKATSINLAIALIDSCRLISHNIFLHWNQVNDTYIFLPYLCHEIFQCVIKKLRNLHLWYVA